MPAALIATEKEEVRGFSHLRDFFLRISLAIVTTLWLAFLFFQKGKPWDEAEHAHAAWLISQGKRPIDDFFQHHLPVIWNFLAIYFYAGFSGPGVLIWGRMLVVFCALALLLGITSLERHHSGTPLDLSRSIGFVTFASMTLLLPDLFIARPETLSSAFFFLALALWNRSQSSFYCEFVSGFLVGATCYTSPRFLVLIGLLLLIGRQSMHRWAILGAGSLSFVSMYTVATGFSIEKAMFCLRFSAHLQSINDGAIFGDAIAYYLLLLMIIGLFLTAMLTGTSPANRMRGRELIAFTILVFFVCFLSAGKFQYHQAYAPFVSATAAAAAWLGARIEKPRRLVLISSGLLLAAVIGVLRPPSFDFISMVHARTALADAVPPGQKMLLFNFASPITVQDVSYYGSPLADGQDRLCRAIRSFQSKLVLPPCDFFADLRDGRPFVTDIDIHIAVSLVDTVRTLKIVNSHYHSLNLAKETLSQLRSARGSEVYSAKMQIDQPIMIRSDD